MEKSIVFIAMAAKAHLSFMVTIPFSFLYSTLEPFKAISFRLR